MCTITYLIQYTYSFCWINSCLDKKRNTKRSLYWHIVYTRVYTEEINTTHAHESSNGFNTVSSSMHGEYETTIEVVPCIFSNLQALCNVTRCRYSVSLYTHTMANDLTWHTIVPNQKLHNLAGKCVYNHNILNVGSFR